MSQKYDPKNNRYLKEETRNERHFRFGHLHNRDAFRIAGKTSLLKV